MKKCLWLPILLIWASACQVQSQAQSPVPSQVPSQVPSPVPSQVQPIEELWQQAIQSYKAKDFTLFQSKMEQIQRRRPYQMNVLRNLVRAYSLSGNPEKALTQIKNLILQGISLEFNGEDYATVTSHPAFPALKDKLMANQQPLGNAQIILSLDRTGLLPEAIAIHEKSGDYYVGSVRKGQILKISPEGNISIFAEPSKENKLMGVFGLKIDQQNSHLWAASGTIEQHIGLNKDKGKTTGIFQFDLLSGKLLNSYFPTDDGKHLFGDLIITPAGEIYVSDSYSPVIYRINKEKTVLEPFFSSDQFVNPQGLCLAGNKLYLADYNTGLFRLDMSSKKLTRLTHGANINVGGIDGLYCYGDSLIGIQNGVTPHRIVKLRIEGDHITELTELNKNLARWDEPTLGMIRQGEFIYVATSQWGAYDQKGAVKATAKLRPVLIMKTKLE